MHFLVHEEKIYIGSYVRLLDTTLNVLLSSVFYYTSLFRWSYRTKICKAILLTEHLVKVSYTSWLSCPLTFDISANITVIIIN
jgi:hypothetical protein